MQRFEQSAADEPVKHPQGHAYLRLYLEILPRLHKNRLVILKFSECYDCNLD
jgi:hypothetical protein